MKVSSLGDGGIRCNACGQPLDAADQTCPVCGIGPHSGKRFWRVIWGGMLLSTVIILVVCAVVLIYAPRYAPHLFQTDPRNLIP